MMRADKKRRTVEIALIFKNLCYVIKNILFRVLLLSCFIFRPLFHLASVNHPMVKELDPDIVKAVVQHFFGWIPGFRTSCTQAHRRPRHSNGVQGIAEPWQYSW